MHVVAGHGDWFGGKVTRSGDMLIFVAGRPPIYGRQVLYFQDKDLQSRAEVLLPAPRTSHKKEASK